MEVFASEDEFKAKVDVGQVHGVNCFTARWNWQGIAATAETRTPRDVAGQRLKIRFEIVDRRFGVLAGPVKEGEVDPNRVQRGPYTVYLTLQVCTMLLYNFTIEMSAGTGGAHASGSYCGAAHSTSANSALFIVLDTASRPSAPIVCMLLLDHCVVFCWYKASCQASLRFCL